MCSSNSTDTWAVLVAGEHHTVSKSLGGHASITSIGDAFDILRLRLPRDRIIVIAQLEECRIWHDLDFEHKVKDVKDFDSAERQRPMWEEKKESFQKHLGGLMSDGGADYDGAMVNPDTVLRVILGEKSDKYPKVIEYQEGKTKVFFSLFGHGSWNGKDENHYFYFPYPSDPILRSLSQTARRNPPPTATNEADNLAGDFVFNDGSINAAGQIDASPTNDSDQTPHPIVSTLLDIDVTSQRPIIEYEPALSDRSVSAVSAVTASLLTQTQTPSQSPESLSDGAMPSDPTASRVQPDGPPIAIAESDPDNPDGCDSESPVECVGLHDPLYQSINSYLPLKGGPHTPFRVQISPIPKPGKPPKTKEQLDTADASVLHWQFLFDALHHICLAKKPKGVFIFQQSCGSGGMWLWLQDNPVYEEAYRCSQWPLFVGYTSEPETSAVGASWGVFYGLLGRVLRGDEGDTESLLLKETEEVEQDWQIPDIGIARCKQRAYTEGSTSLHFSSCSPLPSPHLTIAEFYSTMTAEYYRVEPFVHHVNFALSQEERAKEAFVKFGVLGSAQGAGGESVVGAITVSSFFS